MTERGAGRSWQDPQWVDRWVDRDARRTAVATAREIAVHIIGLDSSPATVLELAAGPGSFLAAFLTEFPHAHGIWSDTSVPMAGHARARLAAFEGRVSFALIDIRTPAIQPAVDVLVCARVTHTLTALELAQFYQRTATLLRPGGWLVNLDHVSVDSAWKPRYDQLLPRFYEGAASPSPSHQKERPGHRIDAHLAALAGAGLDEADIPWRLLSTALILARRRG